MSIKKTITVQKTARYFQLGTAGPQTKSAWFVCHGYAQLASYFLDNFKSLDNGERLIIAPEGLHRFYWQGFSGKVVASWMTKEDREDDIRDYVNFLDAVYDEVMKELDHHVTVNVLGFSQGVATACRWLSMGKTKADNLIMWAGMFPGDLHAEILRGTKIYALVGSQDEFIDEVQKEELKKFLMQYAPGHELQLFHGRHEIHQESLSRLAAELG